MIRKKDRQIEETERYTGTDARTQTHTDTRTDMYVDTIMWKHPHRIRCKDEGGCCLWLKFMLLMFVEMLYLTRVFLVGINFVTGDEVVQGRQWNR